MTRTREIPLGRKTMRRSARQAASWGACATAVTVLVAFAACSRREDTANEARVVGADDAAVDGGSADDVFGGALDGGRVDAMKAGPAPLPGCALSAPGIDTCGPDAGERCCESPLIPGGTFNILEDGTPASPPPFVRGTISPFRLDRFEVSTGRFRRFVGAVESGWTPPAGSGKHTYLNSGKGLTLGPVGVFEPGWVGEWSALLPKDSAAWTEALSCPFTTWTAAPGDYESRPINCTNWFEAYAFCIWDGGFLPTISERSFAVAGGGEQRVYPWSTPSDAGTVDCSYANFGGADFPKSACVGAGQLGVRHTASVGSRSPKGDGKWGHADLAGNVTEWLLDRRGVLANPCVDCLSVLGSNPPPETHLSYGGDYSNNNASQLASFVRAQRPESRAAWIGLRCGRAP